MHDVDMHCVVIAAGYPTLPPRNLSNVVQAETLYWGWPLEHHAQECVTEAQAYLVRLKRIHLREAVSSEHCIVQTLLNNAKVY